MVLTVSCKGAVLLPLLCVIAGRVGGVLGTVHMSVVFHGKALGDHPFIQEGCYLLLRIGGGYVRAGPIVSRGQRWE